MKDVDLYLKVRHAVRIEGLSERAAARRFGIDPRTVNKMMKFSVPPGYVRKKPPAKPKLDPFIVVIDGILGDDKLRPKKQQHTAKRLYERLRDEHGFTGGITIVKDYVAGWRQRAQEMFVPLLHSPGHAQADFGEAIGVIGGVERKIHFFAMDLPHSDACFVVAYPAETTEAFCDGHVRAFAFFGGVPQSILYDNTKIAVARILGDGKRQRTRVFTELQSHYLFEDRFGRPGKGNDKGKVEGLVGYARRNFLVPIPVFESFEALNAHLLECCRRRMADCLRGHEGTIGERLERDLAAFQTPLPAPYDACEKVPTSVSSLSLVRYRLNDYSVPTTYGHRDVLVRGYVPARPIGDSRHALRNPCDLRRARLCRSRRIDELRSQYPPMRFDKLASTPAGSSRGRSPPICRCCNLSSNLSSTCRQPRRSASKSRRRCSPAPTR
jgi:transposase